MRRVGHQAAVGVEERAGVIEALADVDRLRGRLEHLAHLLGDVHEEVVEYLDAGGVGRRRHPRPWQRAALLEQQLAAGKTPGTPALLQHHGAVRFDDQRRSLELGAQRAHRHERHLAPAAEPGAHPLRQLARGGGFGHHEGGGIDRGEARLDPERLDHRLERTSGEPEAPQMLGVERLAKLPEASERHREGDVAVTGAHLEEARDAHSGAVGSARGELGARLALELIERRAGRGEARLIQRAAQARAAHGEPIRHADAERREHARQRMHQDAARAGGARHPAGVLAGGAAEAEQRELARIASLACGDLADGVRHRFDSDLEERLGEHLERAGLRAWLAELPGERGEGGVHLLRIDGRAALGPEHRRQGVGAQMSEQHLHVGEGQRPAPPVTDRPRVRPRGGGSHREAPVVVAEDGAAAGRNAVHVQHRLVETRARNEVLETLRQLAVDQRHVGRGATHVEADEAPLAEALAHPMHADQSARGPRQDARHGVKALGRRQPAVALHQ